MAGTLVMSIGMPSSAVESAARDGARPLVGFEGAAREAAAFALFVDDFSLFDHDVFNRHVAVEAARGGANASDRVNDVLAGDDAAEDGIAPALRRGRGVVEEVVVGDVDEELGGRRVRIRRAGHGDRVAVVLEAVGRFVLNRGHRGLLLEARLEAAALDHEAGDDAVEDRAVVEARLHVGFKVGACLRRMFVVEFDVDDALVGSKADHLFKASKLILNGRKAAPASEGRRAFAEWIRGDIFAQPRAVT